MRTPNGARRITSFAKTRHAWPLLVPVIGSAMLIALPLVYLSYHTLAGRGEAAPVLHAGNIELLLNTLALAGGVLVAVTALAAPMAWLTARTALFGRRAWAVLAVLPLAIPGYVMAYAMRSLGGYGGAWNEIVGAEQGGPLWFHRPEGYLWALAALTAYNLPYMFLTLRASMIGLDPSLEEAARSLGHSRLRVWFTVVVPQLLPALLAGAMLVILHVVADFGVVSLLKFDTLSRDLYVKYNAMSSRDAAPVAMLLLLVAAVFIAGEMFFLRKLRLDRAGVGAGRQRGLTKLGWWQGPAVLLMAAVFVLSVVVPAGTVMYWMRGTEENVAVGQASRLSSERASERLSSMHASHSAQAQRAGRNTARGDAPGSAMLYEFKPQRGDGGATDTSHALSGLESQTTPSTQGFALGCIPGDPLGRPSHRFAVGFLNDWIQPASDVRDGPDARPTADRRVPLAARPPVPLPFVSHSPFDSPKSLAVFRPEFALSSSPEPIVLEYPRRTGTGGQAASGTRTLSDHRLATSDNDDLPPNFDFPFEEFEEDDGRSDEEILAEARKEQAEQQSQSSAWQPVGSALWNSVRASLPAAIVATLLAIPFALLRARYPSKLSFALERLPFIGYAVPALAFALSLIILCLRGLPAGVGDLLYHSMPLLVFALALHFLAEGVGPVRSSLYLASPRVEEASRSLGRGPLATFLRVTLPLLRHGAIVSLALVFLSCMKELPLTMLLSPSGFDTLATEVWNRSEEVQFDQAAPFALTILVFSAIFVGVLLMHGREKLK